MAETYILQPQIDHLKFDSSLVSSTHKTPIGTINNTCVKGVFVLFRAPFRSTSHLLKVNHSARNGYQNSSLKNYLKTLENITKNMYSRVLQENIFPKIIIGNNNIRNTIKPIFCI